MMPVHTLVNVTTDHKVYVARRRVHHGLLGAILALIGIAVAFHDRRDWPWPFSDRT